MNYKNIICFSTLLCVSFLGFGQEQQGYVKTQGRMVNGKHVAGKRVPDATVQVKGRSAVVSSQDGTFSIPLPSKSFSLSKVQKKGYVLFDPDILYHTYTYSPSPLELVLEDSLQRETERRAIERKVRANTYEELRRQGEEIEALLEQNRITEEKYRELLQKHNANQDKNETLIKGLVDWYMKTDFDHLDDLNRRIADALINGRLQEADSLINSQGDPDELESALRRQQAAVAKEAEVLAQRQANLEMAIDATQRQLEDLAQNYYNRHTLCQQRYKIDSAAYWLERRAQLDTTNAIWQHHAGYFIDEFLGDYSKGMTYNTRALTIQKRVEGENHPTVATAYNNMGVSCIDMGRYSQALVYLNKALSIREKLVGKKHSDVATLYNNIGGVYSDLGEYSKALEYYNKALNINQKVLGKECPDVALSYNNLGSVYSKLGNYSKAKEYHKKALSIRENVLGKEDPELATSYNNLGSIYSELGNYFKALDYYNRALSIREKVLGEEHPAIASLYNNIGQVYSYQEDYAKALTYYNKALSIQVKMARTYSPITSAIYGNIGNMYIGQMKYDKALEFWNKALSIDLIIYGDDHANVALAYLHIGNIYFYQENDIMALEYLYKALAIYKKTLGKNHPTTKQLEETIDLLKTYDTK